MINRLLYFIGNYMHCRCIIVNNEPYLERYFITANIFLHRFVSPDGERHIHDHQWPWALSFILTGWYIEDLDHQGTTVKRRWFNFIGKNYFHRITSAMPDTWTLFITGERNKEWGFLNADGSYKVMPSQPDVTSYKDYPLGKNNSDRAPL